MSAPPNILFLLADQLRYDALSAVTPSLATTPALDRIAAEGLRVEYAVSSTPTCTPARAAILTGRSPWRHGMLGLGSIAPRYPFELPRALRDAGYATAVVGKDHFGWNETSDRGVDHGFEDLSLYDGLGRELPSAQLAGRDARATPVRPSAGASRPADAHHWKGEWDDYDRWFDTQLPGKDPQATLDGLHGEHGWGNCSLYACGWNGWRGRPYVYDERLHPTAWVGRGALAYIHGRAAAEASGPAAPWLLKASFHRPHSPYDPPRRLLEKFLNASAAFPPVAVCPHGGWDEPFAAGARCGPSNPVAWCGRMPPNETVNTRAAYFASVAFVDEQVGLIYTALRSTRLLERTLILFTSDHGDAQGEHYHWRKGYAYESSAHVPMLLRWPESWEDGGGALRRGPAAASAATSARAAVRMARGAVVRPPIVGELRDVFATFLHAAGPKALRLAPTGYFDPADGKSLLCLAFDPTGGTCDYPLNPGPWRRYIDLEHSRCYDDSVHWSALTDGRTKFIFHAFSDKYQLFNLTADPKERLDLSDDAAHANLLELWRARMAAQFEAEGRGPLWVSRSGVLRRRVLDQVYSPNYPRHANGSQPVEEEGGAVRVAAARVAR